MSVYDRATRAVPEDSRLDMFRLYIKKVEQHYGLTKTRPIYERAISQLNDDMCRTLCVEFAEMERKLGEIDRARLILVHGSQFGDPRRESAYWKAWREFEESHGNEDTFREMLRVKRSVEAAFAQVNYLSSNMIAGEQLLAPESDVDALARKAEEEARLKAHQGSVGQKRTFVASSQNEEIILPLGAAQSLDNPDEILLDDEES